MSSSDLALSVRGAGKAYTIVHNATDHVTMAEVVLERLKHPLRRADREKFWAVRNIEFDLHHGEVLGLVGRNGAGKSTLLKLLGRITAPTEGEIKLWGRVGSLLEVGTGFHPELTGRENVFLNGSILGMTTKEIRAQFDAIVDFAGVAKFLDTPVKRYSSGMYVRLAFAVAAHLETEILLVDEVLSVGDADFQKKCLGKMRDVATTGRTVILVSHQMDNVRALCDRVLLLDHGGVEFIGNVREGVNRYLERPTIQTTAADPALRPGSGEMRITNAWVDCDNSAAEEPKVIRFTIERRSELAERCFIAVTINDSEGRAIAHCDSNMVGAWFTPGDGSVDGEFKLTSPWLQPGDYSVDLFLCNAGVLDAFERALSFTVRPGYPYRGGASDALVQRDLVVPDFDVRAIPGSIARASSEIVMRAPDSPEAS
ncbi:MAG: ABC transporter ATP-binding protein [Actinobacteria bacterium]|nr:ABC transporter ATP-binding protein [Actinomycetota bacterium]